MSIMPIMAATTVSPALSTSGISPLTGAGLDPTVQGASSSGSDFASVLADSVDSLQATQAKADDLAVQAATGDLKDVHDYTIAATQASVATELAVTLRNKGVEAFNEILRMPV